MPLVGIIANPASGKDIRRLVAHGSVFDNQEKVRIVRRVLTGLAATGVDQVCFMPDYFGIVVRALKELKLDMKVFPANFKPYGNQDDSTKTARILEERGASCVITLGGDGTNRAIVKGSRNLVMVPISTGTNNVFPTMVEGTIAGLAAGLVATGKIAKEDGCYHSSLLEVEVEGEVKDIALVDAVVCDERFVGAKAVWDMSKVRQLVLNRAQPDSIGLSSIGGLLANLRPDDPRALCVYLGPDGENLCAPVAPGVIAQVGVEDHYFFNSNEKAKVALTPSVIALDGEREVEIRQGQDAYLKVAKDGPWVVEVQRAMAAAQACGVFKEKMVALAR